MFIKKGLVIDSDEHTISGFTRLGLGTEASICNQREHKQYISFFDYVA